MSTSVFVLPGDPIPISSLPSTSSTTPLKLGPGLRHIPPDTITPIVPGELCTDNKKNAIWVENSGGRYVPTAGDTVIATIHHSSPDLYHCALTPFTSLASLPQLSFPGASKKTRPMLAPGAIVYARISLANRHMDPELECLNPATGKADGLGELKGGMLFDISLGMARRLMMPDPARQGALVLLEDLAEKLPFEIAVGRNGRLWVDAGSIARTLAVGKAVVGTDGRGLSVEEQRKLCRKILKDF